MIIAAAPMAAVVVIGVLVAVLILVLLARFISQKRTARRVRQVEESRMAGTLPPDVAHALEQASRRSASTRPRA